LHVVTRLSSEAATPWDCIALCYLHVICIFRCNLHIVTRLSSEAATPRDCISLHGHSGAVYSVCYLHSSPHLLSASADKTGLFVEFETLAVKQLIA